MSWRRFSCRNERPIVFLGQDALSESDNGRQATTFLDFLLYSTYVLLLPLLVFTFI